MGCNDILYIVVTTILTEGHFMSIPSDVLAIDRPKNTIVKATRTPGVYSVVKRTSKRVEGKKNPIPVEIGVIGKICNGEYIPNPPKIEYETDMKIYGDFALCDKVGKSIFDDLLKFYNLDNAKKIYCMALLRVINPDIVNEEIQYEYKTSYISEVYPNVALSPNTISSFLENIGMHLIVMDNFMNDRIRQYSGHSTIIDGMLKTNNSYTNIYSEFSRKGRIKGVEDINLIYAYDLEMKEPVACSIFAGNMLDFTCFRSFIQEHPIENGFIILDKGFDDSISKEEIASLGTKYLIPVKVSSTLIRDYELDKKYTNHFKYGEDSIRCKKISVDDKYYYAFKSTEMKSNQEKGYIDRAFEKGSFNEDKYEKKSSKFGLIVFESNADLNLKDIYDAYQERWEIETVFNNYKNIINRQEINVQGNYRLFATEFINFISSIISLRIKNLLVKTKINDQYTQHQVMRFLSKVAKRRSTKNPKNWIDCARLKYINNLCLSLGV